MKDIVSVAHCSTTHGPESVSFPDAIWPVAAAFRPVKSRKSLVTNGLDE